MALANFRVGSHNFPQRKAQFLGNWGWRRSRTALRNRTGVIGVSIVTSRRTVDDHMNGRRLSEAAVTVLNDKRLGPEAVIRRNGSCCGSATQKPPDRYRPNMRQRDVTAKGLRSTICSCSRCRRSDHGRSAIRLYQRNEPLIRGKCGTGYRL